MKVIIAGSRHLGTPMQIVAAVEASKFKITQVVCGMARGVDLAGRNWAYQREIRIVPFPAHWRLPNGVLDKGAGFRRNQQMAEYADALIAVWDGHSRGTKHMIECMERMNKPVHIELIGYEDPEEI